MNYAIAKPNALGQRQVIALDDNRPVDGTECVSLIPGDKYQHKTGIITIKNDTYQDLNGREIPNEKICLSIIAGQLIKI